MNNHLATFYTILGKTLGLAVVGAAAYQQSQNGGASSLLQPQNLAALIAAAEQAIFAQAPPAPAPPVAPRVGE